MDCPDRDESSLALSGQRWVKPSAVDRDESSLALSGEQWVMLRAFRDKHWAKLSSERDLQRWSLALSKKKCSLIGTALSHNFLFCFLDFLYFIYVLQKNCYVTMAEKQQSAAPDSARLEKCLCFFRPKNHQKALGVNSSSTYIIVSAFISHLHSVHH